MSKENSARNGCKDVFRSFLVQNAEYSGELEIPIIRPEHELPNRLITFSKAIGTQDTDCWVHFYEDDARLERLWTYPRRYLPILRRFRGVISPDFSLYRDMPLVMQQWNTYRGRALGHWLQENGVKVIPNVRFGDNRTYGLCCEGVQPKSIIAVGTHGCMKIHTEKQYFQQGLTHVVDVLNPATIIVYGAAPDSVFKPIRDKGVNVIPFESVVSSIHKAVIA